MKTFLLVAFLVFAFCSADAQRAGTLDSSFGKNGLFISKYSSGQNRYIGSSVLKGDRVIVVSISLAEINGVKVSRFLADGKPDFSFGTEGSTLLDYGTIGFTCIAVQKDEKIILGGSQNGILRLARITSEGSPDSTFGINGIYSDTSNKRQTARGIAIQPDGKIVICANSYGSAEGSVYAMVARFNSNGQPDESFGTNGQSIYTNNDMFPLCIALQKDGRILIGGDQIEGAFKLLCYRADGSLDKTFGNQGQVITYFGRYECLSMILLYNLMVK